jgi:chromate transporter
MNLLVLYLVLCKAMLTSFSGPTSLPVVREDMVKQYHVITDQQLEAAVAAGRATPGPFGLYIVSVGYMVRGVPGAVVGVLALITPAFLIIPMIRYVGHRLNQPQIRSAILSVTLAAVGLLLSTTVSLARDTLTSVVPILIAMGSFAFLVMTKKPTLWAVLGAAVVGALGGLLLPK